MKWRRTLASIILSVPVLVTMAVRAEKPSVLLHEQRPDRIGTHFRKVAFAPDSDTVWAVGFGGVIMRSENAGKTWERQNSGTQERLYGLGVMNTDTVYCCGSNGTLLVTKNGGRSWQRLVVPTRRRLIDVFFINIGRGWVVGDNGCVWRTLDGGMSWKELQTGFESGFRTVWFRDEQRGFIAGYEGMVLETENGGDSWNRIPIPEHISFYGAHFHSDGNTFVLVGSCGMMLESADSGRNWKIHPVRTTNFLRDIDFSGDGFGCSVGYDVILTKSPDSDQWVRHREFSGFQLQSVATGKNGTAVAAGHWGAILRTVDFGRTWEFQESFFAPDLHAVAWSPVSGDVIGVGADGWTLIKRAGSENWIASHTGSRETLRSVAADPSGRFWVLDGTAGSVYRFTLQAKWEKIHIPADTDRNLNAIVFAGKRSGFIVGDGGTLLVTDNGGVDWNLQNLPTRKNVRSIHFTDERNGYVTGDDGLVMETRNGGQTWLGQFTGATHDFLTGMFGSDGHALIISPFGVLESWSNGRNASWFETAFDIPVTAIAPGARFAGLVNGRVLDRQTGIVTNGVNDPIMAYASDSSVMNIWGAGRFGRIIRLTAPGSTLKLTRQP